ncbi:hypothetical protein IW152_003508 [Coemansia sp. BCRC 34962]|nr:hypothetical protein IW152_003508 [Coemansia sp. BCRC 34962]
MDAATELFSDVNGNEVVYPNLQYLELLIHFGNQPDIVAAVSTSTPFPALRTLKLDGTYPFDDDVLFRGNSTTLESLSLRLDDKLIDILSRERVFKNKLKVLRNLTIYKLSINNGAPVDSQVNIGNFLNDTMSTVKRLTVSDPKAVTACIEAAEQGSGFQNIEAFRVNYHGLTIFEILRVLKAFPALITLESSISVLGPELKNISAMNLPDYIASTYCNAGKNLQVWRMTFFAKSDDAQFIDCLLLLALASPQLRRLEFLSRTVTDYQGRVAEALKSETYSKYAAQLGRLANAAYKLHDHGPYM